MAESKPGKPAPKNQPIIDVAHPGKTPPDVTSRPVIVTNRAIMKDPMVVGEKPQTDLEVEPTKSQPLSTKPAVKLKPLEEPASDKPGKPAAGNEPEETEPADNSKATTDPEEHLTAASKAVTNEKGADKKSPDSPKSETKAEIVPAGEGEGTEKTEDEKPKDKQLDPVAAEEADAAKRAEHEAAVQKIVDSKQYFLPINSVEKRRTKHLLIGGFIIIVLLAAAWLDFALDAGLVHIQGLHPLTHFFNNK
ncbi:MAG TPA: hypothetical protein VG604_04075 [Candidatus Saccharimonadales bacterium]|nr:hypothetical protein [Candidatus Saccharimonadales bacterium]